MTENAIVYRDFTQQELDDQYNNRARVPDNAEILLKYAKQGEDYVADNTYHRDIKFGDHPDELLDIYPASNGNPNAPVLMYFHGGYWFSRHKDDFQFIGAAFAPVGATVVVVNYSLIPSVDMIELIRQCRAAVTWTATHIGEYGGDPKSIHLTGHSAGGHITAMMFATDWSDWGVEPSCIKSGFAISGLYDLEPIRLNYMNETLGFNDHIVKAYSPTHLKPLVSAPITFSVGGDETEEFRRHCHMLMEPWQAAGLSCDELHVEGLNHFTILGDFTLPDGKQNKRVLSLMGLT